MSIKILLSLLVFAGIAKGTASAVADVKLIGRNMLDMPVEVAPAGRAKDHDLTRSNARI